MYADPSQIRSHVVKLRLNDKENALIKALVDYTGQQEAPLLRDLLLEQARLVLVGDIAASLSSNEGAQLSLLRA